MSTALRLRHGSGSYFELYYIFGSNLSFFFLVSSLKQAFPATEIQLSALEKKAHVLDYYHTSCALSNVIDPYPPCIVESHKDTLN